MCFVKLIWASCALLEPCTRTRTHTQTPHAHAQNRNCLIKVNDLHYGNLLFDPKKGGESPQYEYANTIMYQYINN